MPPRPQRPQQVCPMIPFPLYTQNLQYLTLMPPATLAPDIVRFLLLGVHILNPRISSDDHCQRRGIIATIISRSMWPHLQGPDTILFLQIHDIFLRSQSRLHIRTRNPKRIKRTTRRPRRITLEIRAAMRRTVRSQRLNIESFQAVQTELMFRYAL